jgi:plastocyanin
MKTVRNIFRWTHLVTLLLCAPLLHAQDPVAGVEVTAKVLIQPSSASAGDKKHESDPSNVVVWLSPVEPLSPPPQSAPHAHYQLVQKDKMFTPHLLVVPTGTSVEFPNLDPFYHNVFSLFNGKRFDLGLYESGTRRSVRFDREGVSYIFCNIHPEMSAVILSLSTPYYGISVADGGVALHNVPPGSYRLHVWSENAQPVEGVQSKLVQVGAQNLHMEEIVLSRAASPLLNHKNKFGEDYSPVPPSRY